MVGGLLTFSTRIPRGHPSKHINPKKAVAILFCFQGLGEGGQHIRLIICDQRTGPFQERTSSISSTSIPHRCSPLHRNYLSQENWITDSFSRLDSRILLRAIVQSLMPRTTPNSDLTDISHFWSYWNPIPKPVEYEKPRRFTGLCRPSRRPRAPYDYLRGKNGECSLAHFASSAKQTFCVALGHYHDDVSLQATFTIAVAGFLRPRELTELLRFHVSPNSLLWVR